MPGATGHDPTVRVYSPPTPGSGRPCVYWIHGGGYMFGSGLTVDARLNRWVEEFDCVAVSIEYRLAPEDPYPAPLDDCYAGLLWTARARRRARASTRPASRIAGASAGGGLAAGLAIAGARPWRGRPRVPAAHLSDDRRPQHDARRATSGRAGLEPRGQPPRVARLSRRARRHRRHPGVRGAGAGRERGGPPAGVDRCGPLDVFRDEDIEYASRMLAAGIPPSCTCTRARRTASR